MRMNDTGAVKAYRSHTRTHWSANALVRRFGTLALVAGEAKPERKRLNERGKGSGQGCSRHVKYGCLAHGSDLVRRVFQHGLHPREAQRGWLIFESEKICTAERLSDLGPEYAK